MKFPFRKDQGMKKLLLAMLVALVFAGPAQAQSWTDYRLESLLVSSGNDPISSGISGIARFTNSRLHFVEVATQSEQAWFLLGKYFGNNTFTFALGASVGHLQSAPWAGPYTTAKLKVSEAVSIDGIFWPGFFFEEPDDWKTENDGVENPEGLFKGIFGGVGLTVGPFRFSYHMLNFLDEPINELPGMSFTQAIREDVFIILSGTWNNNDSDLMPWIGISWAPMRE